MYSGNLIVQRLEKANGFFPTNFLSFYISYFSPLFCTIFYFQNVFLQYFCNSVSPWWKENWNTRKQNYIIYGYFLEIRTNVFRRPLLLRTAPFLWEQRKKRAGGKYRETSRTKRKRKSDCLFAPYIFELQDNLSYPSNFKCIKNPDFLLCATQKYSRLR